MAEDEQGSTTDESPAGVPGVTGAYGEAKARELLRRFREDTGRDPASATELAEWIIQSLR